MGENRLSKADLALLKDLDVVVDPVRLAKLAGRWIGDPSPEARLRLLDYLGRPMHPLHEPLLVRLLRLATRRRDDAVMVRLMVLFDRSIRRYFTGERWRLGPWPSATRMHSITEQCEDFTAYRIMGVTTRRIMRQRIWRYFDNQGKIWPRKFVAVATEAMLSYNEKDTFGAYRFLDNWCLVHLLYQNEPHLHRTQGGWVWRGSTHSIHQLEPAPFHAYAWFAYPEKLREIEHAATSPLIRNWAARMLAQVAPKQSAPVISPPKYNPITPSPQLRDQALARMPIEQWRTLAASSTDRNRMWIFSQLETYQHGKPRVLTDALPLTDETLKVLWARLLLTLHGSWKPLCRTLIRQLSARLEARPEETDTILPMLCEIARNTKGQIWEETLAEIIRAVEKQPERVILLQRELPEVHLVET